MTTRRLAAILAADVVGFSSMMERDEEGTAARIRGTPTRGDRAYPCSSPRTAGEDNRRRLSRGVCQSGRSGQIGCERSGASCIGDANGLQLRIGVNLGDIIIEDGRRCAR